ncbi:MAG: FAD-dependent oxidoreductase, partial [Actinobacteria bacterium]|nr:FAD-dependent oxidoreductase [Actinomycetota bacterium]
DAWYRAVPQIEIATAPAQDGAWEEEMHELHRLGVADAWIELDPAQVQSICRSPVFRGGALQPVAATVQPARLAFGLRRALLERGVKIFEGTDVTAVDQQTGGVTVRTRGGRVRARSAVLAVNSATLHWRPFAGELSVASSHIVLTEPVPEVLEEIGWTGGEALCDCRQLLHYLRTTPDGRIAFGWGGGRLAFGARHGRLLDVDPQVVQITEAALRRFFPQLGGARVSDAWGGPIDVSPGRLAIFRSLGALHAGWGFSGHGVGPSHLGGRILAALALGAGEEFAGLPLLEPPRRRFPPEPLRWAGGSLARRALMRRDRLADGGRRVDPLTRAVAGLPKALGINLPR